MNLRQAASHAFGKSQRYFALSIAFGIAICLVTVISLLPIPPLGDTFVVCTLLGMEVLQLLSKYRASFWFEIGDVAKRADQEQQSLSLEPPPTVVQRLVRYCGECGAKPNPKYWRHRFGVGPRRLVDMIGYSATFTEDVSNICFVIFLSASIVGIVICVMSLISAAILGSDQKIRELVVHVVGATLALFLSADVFMASMQYRDLGNVASSTAKRALDLLHHPEVSIEDALRLQAEYNIAVVQAPPLLTVVHKWRRRRLESAYSAATADLDE